MVESIDNLIQLIVFGICFGISLRLTYTKRSRAMGILSLFYISFFLGDLYWLLYIVFYDSTPQVFYVSEFNWYASYLFLILLMQQTLEPEARRQRSRVLLLPLVFAAGMCVFFMQWGDYISNIISAVLMGLMMFRAMQGSLYCREKDPAAGHLTGREKDPAADYLTGREKDPATMQIGYSAKSIAAQMRLCRLILVFCVIEYVMWTVSCFWRGDGLTNPYYWLDGMLTVCSAALLPALDKGVDVWTT